MKFEDVVTFFKRKAADWDGAAQVARLSERLVQTYRQTYVSPVCSATEAASSVAGCLPACATEKTPPPSFLGTIHALYGPQRPDRVSTHST